MWVRVLSGTVLMLLAELNEPLPQAPPPVVFQAKYSVRSGFTPNMYSSSTVSLHLFKTIAVSVGAAFNETHASKVACVPGVKASRSGASTKLLIPSNARQALKRQAVL